MEKEEIKELIDYLEASKLKKLIYRKGDLELHLEKESSFADGSRRSSASSCEPAHFETKGEKASSKEKEGTYVRSPMVGTFYAASGPDEPPFVKVGDKVEADTVVCIVEAMKVMNEVKAGVSGTVAEILVEDAQPVEFGTNLLRII